MSTSIIYRARVAIDPEDEHGDTVLLQCAAQDNNLRPLPGTTHRQAAGTTLHTFKKLWRGKPEEAAEYFEGLARDYDGGMIRENAIRGDSGHLSGARAYDLWANRWEKATGTKLRAPQLSRVVSGGIPSYMFLDPPKRIQVKKGDIIPLDKAIEIAKTDHQVKIDLNGVKGRLGFVTKEGNLCYYAHKKRNRGYHIGSIPIKAEEGLDTWEGRPGIEHAQVITSDATQKDNNPKALYIKGTVNDRTVYLERTHGGFQWDTFPAHYNTLAGFTDTAELDRCLKIIAKVTPEVMADAIAAKEIPGTFFEEGQNPLAIETPAPVVAPPEPAPTPTKSSSTPLPEIYHIPKERGQLIGGGGDKAPQQGAFGF